MSLTDAFLLDPCREPQEVWLAASRSDGQRGDGTQANPYNCASLPHPTIPILQIILTKDSPPAPYEATALTAGLHGFREVDMVSVAGGEVITDPNNGYAGFANVNYHGTFRIKSVSSRSFTYQMLGRPYHSTAQTSVLNPLACWREREQFDVIMRGLSPNTTIHLGPGVFETKGFAANNTVAGRWKLDSPGNHVVVPGSWAAQNGQRIVGSGIAITTIKLVGATARNSHYSAIGTSWAGNNEDYLDGFEACDFTVDCNADGQPSPHVACAAIALQRGGRHVRIRRVRAIRFGSMAPDYYVENFVFFTSVPVSEAQNPDSLIEARLDTHDCVYEDCIAEQRSPNAVWNSSIGLIGGADVNTFSYRARGCAIRNCYLNDEFVYGPVVAVELIEYDSVNNIATVTTKWPHGYSVPGNIVVRGCANDAFNGVFSVESVSSDTVLTYKPFPGASDNQLGDIFLGGGISSEAVQIRGLEKVPETDSTYKLTTNTPHHRTVNNNLRVAEVKVVTLLGTDISKVYNGSFQITKILSRTELEFTLLGDPQTEGPIVGLGTTSTAYTTIPSIGLTVAGCTSSVAEGNRIYHCSNGGPWHDTFSSLDTLSRNNYYADVRVGPSENLYLFSAPYANSYLTRVGSIATFTSLLGHGLPGPVGGEVANVTIANATVPPGFSNPYNGTFTVTIIDAFSFTYDLGTLPNPAPPNPSGAPTFDYAGQGPRPVNELTARKVMNGFKGTFRTALFTHGLSAGDGVKVSGAASPGFNGSFTVLSVSADRREFSYLMEKDPGPIAGGSPTFERLYETRRLVVVNNVMEIGFTMYSTFYGQPSGVYMAGSPDFPPYRHKGLVIRDNVIRHNNNALDPTGTPFAVVLGGFERGLIESNIINLYSVRPAAFIHNSSGALSYFDNRTMSGKLEQGVDNGTTANRKSSDLALSVADALALSL